MEYEIIIIGGGIAGFSAAIYSCRRNLNTLLLTKDIGGQLATASIIENYPGIDRISGPELSQRLFNQAKKFGTKIKFEEVIRVDKKEDYFLVKTAKNVYQGKVIIVAAGLFPRKLKLEGEERLIGRGISYCATCDAPLFKGKVCGVVGGGSAGLDAAILLAGLSPRVYLIHRRDQFNAEPILEKRLKEKKNIILVLNSIVKEIKGRDRLEKIVVENIKTKEEKEISLDGLFIEIGHEAKVDFIKHLVKVNQQNKIIVDQKMATSQEGIFACGDITASSYNQAVTSAAQGVQAALEAYKYLLNKEDKTKLEWSSKI
jgi:thioredoxin reductase (NADPH)